MISSRWAMAGYVTAAAIGVVFVWLALAELWGDSQVPPRTSLVAFAVHDEVEGAVITAQILDVDPNDPSANLGMYFSFSFGTEALAEGTRTIEPIHSEPEPTNPPHVEEASSGTPLQLADQVQPPDGGAPEGISIVLAGPVASALVSCNDPRFAVVEEMAFDSLSNLEKKAVVEYLRASDTRAEIAEASDFVTADDVVPADSVALASTLDYTVIQPTELYAYDSTWEVTSDASENRQIGGWYNYVTCQFSSIPFWTDLGTRQVFAFPALAASSASADDAASVLESTRRAQILVAPYMDLVYAEGVSTDTPAGNSRFESRRESWTTARPVITDDGFRLYFEDLSGLRWREWSFFLAGIGVSIIATVAALAIVRWSTREAAAALDRRAVVRESDVDAHLAPEARP